MLYAVFLLGVFIGFGAGYAAALYIQLQLEQLFKQYKIAKIDGEFYRITKIDFKGGGNS